MPQSESQRPAEISHSESLRPAEIRALKKQEHVTITSAKREASWCKLVVLMSLFYVGACQVPAYVVCTHVCTYTRVSKLAEHVLLNHGCMHIMFVCMYVIFATMHTNVRMEE
jgi:hypothetical protein